MSADRDFQSRHSSGGEDGPARRTARRPAPARFLTAASIDDLPDVTVRALLPGAPIDEHRNRKGTGVVVRPRVALPLLYNAGRPFGRIQPTQSGGDTWVPVIGRRPGWLRVLLPARSSGATGWLDAARVTRALSRHESASTLLRPDSSCCTTAA